MRPLAAPAGPSTFLTAERRTQELESLAEGSAVDLLVIGGGVTGAGIALDAVTRGLSVALVEQQDLANGTSRWSSKLVHGGLRYLANGDFGIAWESARERHILATITAPHLVRPLPQVIPWFERRESSAAALTEVGIRLGDTMRALSGTSRSLLPRMRRIGSVEARAWAPALAAGRLRTAILCWDAQLEDDARLVVALARTAAGHGARVLTYCAATELTGGGACVSDELSGQSFVLRARHVINATGVWADRLVSGIELRPSRGSHLLIAGARLGNPRAMLNVPDPRRFGRFVFAAPRQDGLVMVGLTDEPFDAAEIPDAPGVTERDEQFLLGSLSRALDVPLGPADVIGRFAGLRPLLAGVASSTRDLSRRHAVIEDPESGAITVVGGKLTTYRRMARDAVDAVVRRDGRALRACQTAHLQLVGASTPRASSEAGGRSALVRRFGSEADEIRALAEGRPELLAPVVEGADVLGVEWLAAVQREGALTLSDVLDRRTRLGLVPAWREEARGAAQRILAGSAALVA